jgi:glutathione S-transferase
MENFNSPDREQPKGMQGLLFGVTGSAPTYATELMLRHKGVPYRRADLLAGRHAKTLRRKGFPGVTVPALQLGGQILQTNRAIARGLDELFPDPTLFPNDPTERAKVEAAERLGDEQLQPATRRMLIWSINRDPSSVRTNPEIGRVPLPRSRVLRAPLARFAYRYYGITDDVVREDFEALPGTLDTIDGYIGAGVLNGRELNAADFQIAPLIAALLTLSGLRAEFGERPTEAFADRILPRAARR